MPFQLCKCPRSYASLPNLSHSSCGPQTLQNHPIRVHYHWPSLFYGNPLKDYPACVVHWNRTQFEQAVAVCKKTSTVPHYCLHSFSVFTFITLNIFFLIIQISFIIQIQIVFVVCVCLCMQLQHNLFLLTCLLVVPLEWSISMYSTYCILI